MWEAKSASSIRFASLRLSSVFLSFLLFFFLLRFSPREFNLCICMFRVGYVKQCLEISGSLLNRSQNTKQCSEEQSLDSVSSYGSELDRLNRVFFSHFFFTSRTASKLCPSVLDMRPALHLGSLIITVTSHSILSTHTTSWSFEREFIFVTRCYELKNPFG
jgi:hypothetical protein